MNDIAGKAVSTIIIHIVGMALFYVLWMQIIVPMFFFPAMEWRKIVTLYLIIDVLFFLLSKFDN